jgi:glycosyltransferase involved in cell wall biosynthesis
VSAPIRVLQVVQNLNYGGMERLIGELLVRLDPETFEPHLMVLGYVGRFGANLPSRVGVHRSPPLSKWSMLWPRGLARAIAAIGPDIVHTHGGVWYKASLAARLAEVPRLVHTDHGRLTPDPWRSRQLHRMASRRTDAIVAVSEPLSAYLARRVVADPSRLETIVNGVDTGEWRPGPDSGMLRRELGIGPEVPILGSIGRLEPIKGYDVMVEAYARLRAGWSRPGPPPVLVVGGDGIDRASLVALGRERGLEGLFLLGWRDDVHAFHAAFTLFTMSSRSEGTSVSLLEAMSAGLCPVVTDVGGNRDVLGTELSHRLVRPEDPAALAQAWTAALADRAALERDARAARRRIEEAYSLDAMVRAYQRLYRRVIGGAGVRRSDSARARIPDRAPSG